MLLRLSVPAGGELRVVAVDIAKRVAEYLRDRAPDAVGGRRLSRVSPRASRRRRPTAKSPSISAKLNGELQIEAHCGTRSSEVRCPLPA